MTQHLYFIRAEQSGAIKIGIAANAYHRMSELQTGCPEQLSITGYFDVECDGYPARYVESQLHKLLAAKRIRGEWFSVSEHEIDEALRLVARPAQCMPSGFSRTSYMLDYMRQWRAALKAKKP